MKLFKCQILLLGHILIRLLSMSFHSQQTLQSFSYFDLLCWVGKATSSMLVIKNELIYENQVPIERHCMQLEMKST
jgi:hypothetical protein